MAGLQDLIERFPQLVPVANALGLKKTIYEEPELPTPRDMTMNFETGQRDKEPLFGLPRSTIPSDLPKSIEAYRADPKGKYGGTEGLETRPINRLLTGGNYVGKKQIDKPDTNPETSSIYTDPSKATQELYRQALLLGAAEKYGYPTLSQEEAASFVLKEGRTDMGHSGVTFGNKKDVEFQKMLNDTYNIHPTDVNFLAALNSKKRVADKLKIPFAEAWNGTGTNFAGQTGSQYAKDLEAHKQAVAHPKNKQLMDLIRRGMEAGRLQGLPLKANLDRDTSRQAKEVPYKTGGNVKMPKQYCPDGNWKLI